MKNLLVLLMFILVSCASYHNETLKEQNDYVIKNNSSDRVK